MAARMEVVAIDGPAELADFSENDSARYGIAPHIPRGSLRNQENDIG